MKGTTKGGHRSGVLQCTGNGRGSCDTESLDVQQGSARIQWVADLVMVCLYDRGNKWGHGGAISGKDHGKLLVQGW